jgi:hypothetical protein
MSTDVAKLYWTLIRARLRDRSCPECKRSFADATLVSAGEGTTLEEYGLSESSAARVLAATELLRVTCDFCGTSSDVGSSLAQSPGLVILSADDRRPWSPHAMEVYRSVVAARLGDRSCTRCGEPLQTASVESAAGGTTLPEFDLDDDAAIAIVAWTQRLSVRCRCGVALEI